MSYRSFHDDYGYRRSSFSGISGIGSGIEEYDINGNGNGNGISTGNSNYGGSASNSKHQLLQNSGNHSFLSSSELASVQVAVENATTSTAATSRKSFNITDNPNCISPCKSPLLFSISLYIVVYLVGFLGKKR